MVAPPPKEAKGLKESGNSGSESGERRRHLCPFNGEKRVFFQPRLLVVKHPHSWTPPLPLRGRTPTTPFVHAWLQITNEIKAIGVCTQ